jgi:cytidylate kinase
LKRKGTDVNIKGLTEEIAKRDERDRTRAIAPLVPAPEAYWLDTTGLSIEVVLAQILQRCSH